MSEHILQGMLSANQVELQLSYVQDLVRPSPCHTCVQELIGQVKATGLSAIRLRETLNPLHLHGACVTFKI